LKRSEIFITVMSVSLIVYGIIFLADNLFFSQQKVFWEILAYALVTIGGFATLFHYRKDILLGTASNLTSLGLCTLIVQLYTVMTTGNIFVSLESVTYVIGGIVLIYYGVSLFMGVYSGSIKVVVCIAIFAAVALIPIIIEIHDGIFVFKVLSDHVKDIITIVMYVILIVILTRKEMLIASFMKRIRNNSDQMYAEMCVDGGAFINRFNLMTIAQPEDDTGWRYLDEGPIERERVIPLFDNMGNTEILLQLWHGDPRLHLTVRRSGVQTFNVPFSMVVEQIVMDDTDMTKTSKIRLYGADGVFADIRVADVDDNVTGYLSIVKQKIQLERNIKLAKKLSRDTVKGIGNVGRDRP